MVSKLRPNKSLLIVFHGDWVNGNLIDDGDDPCFSNPVPTWGICRPNTRRSLIPGDALFFICKTPNDYLFKGWFEVGQKIDYITALGRFGARQNVIISNTNMSRKDIEWRYPNSKNLCAKNNVTLPPVFLQQVKTSGQVFYQNPNDGHEIDNWKCRRIFLCNAKQFEECAGKNTCAKDNASLNPYSNYIVAKEGKSENLDYLRITLNEVFAAIKFKKAIKTPKNQHNVLRFDEYKDDMLKFIESRKKKSNAIII